MTKTCDIILCCQDNDRPYTLSGKAYSPLIDSMRKDLERRGYRCLSVALPGSRLTGRRGYAHPHSMNAAAIRQKLYNKIAARLGVSVTHDNTLYKNLLKRTNAKLVISIGSPNELAAAARSTNTFHVELLHGIGYTNIKWGWDKLPADQLPQGILSLDPVSTKAFSPLTSRGIEICTIPHPFLKQLLDEGFRKNYSEWMPPEQKTSSYSKQVLVTITWGFAGDHGPHKHLARILPNGLFYDQITELVEERDDIFWHFRLHPLQLRNVKYRKTRNFMDSYVRRHNNTNWRDCSAIPLPCLASTCDCNIGMSSMACYDAAAVGLRSLMLCPNIQPGGILESAFRDLESEGYVKKSKPHKYAINDWINSATRIAPRLTNLADNTAWEAAITWMVNKSGLSTRRTT